MRFLTGFLSVDSDAGNEKGKIGSNYGTIRLQELPKDSNVPGPGQAQNNFNANADVSKELNLLQSGDTQVVRGNLLTLPLGGGLVYVQPVYVKSSGALHSRCSRRRWSRSVVSRICGYVG